MNVKALGLIVGLLLGAFSEPPAMGQGAPQATGPVASLKSGRWSDPGIWAGGAVPSPGGCVRIAAGMTVEMDVPADIGDNKNPALLLEGSLKVSARLTLRGDLAATGNAMLELLPGSGIALAGTPESGGAKLILGKSNQDKVTFEAKGGEENASSLRA